MASSKTPCPTVTKTTHHANCPPPTPSVCAQPECILLSMLDVPCGCPTAVPTSTSYTACPTVCQGACGTAYKTNIESCPTTSPTPTTISTVTSNTCVTIPETTGSACPTITGCTTEDCILLKTITLECGCASIFTKTACATACQLGCATAYDTVYLPCPYSPTSSPVTTVGDVTTTRTGVVLTVPT
jgi:hypothetical protein